MPTAHDKTAPSPTGEPGWIMESPPGAETVLNGRRYVYFAGTGYLGLQGHPELMAASRAAAAQFGIHTATSRAGFGTSPPVREVEQRAAGFLGAEQAVYLASGYAGNFALAAALSGSVDVVFIDEFAHDSLRDAARWLDRLAAPPVSFRHADADHLGELLREHVLVGQRALVMTDGVFPVSGQLAPVSDYLSILDRHPLAALLVDDAHGLAVLGAAGRGTLEHAGVAQQRVNRDLDEPIDGTRVFHTTTLSKAVGGHGGLVAGSAALLDRIRRASGWYRGAGAPAASVAAATAKGLEIVADRPQLRTQLAANVRTVRQALGGLGLDVGQSPSPIIGIRLASATAMQRVHQRLAEEGILIGYTRDYSSAGTDGMLRIAVFATHTPEMIDRLTSALANALREETT